MEREKLPFRKNCEGYLLFGDEIVVRDSGKGYLEFPGGGVDGGEEPAAALTREAFEEAGVILDGELEEINKMEFIWGRNWARTEKQKKRYAQFKGEEMHFFIGRVAKLETPQGDAHESGWTGKQTMQLSEAIAKVESFKPFSEEMKEYYEFQLSVLKILNKVLS